MIFNNYLLLCLTFNNGLFRFHSSLALLYFWENKRSQVLYISNWKCWVRHCNGWTLYIHAHHLLRFLNQLRYWWKVTLNDSFFTLSSGTDRATNILCTTSHEIFGNSFTEIFLSLSYFHCKCLHNLTFSIHCLLIIWRNGSENLSSTWKNFCNARP